MTSLPDRRSSAHYAIAGSQTLAIHSLEHFALAVADLAVAERFYTTFGLRVANVADDLKPFEQRLEAGRIALLDRPHALAGEGLWFRDPDGVLVEVMVRERRSPTTKGLMEVRLAAEGVRRAQSEIGKKTVPRRLASRRTCRAPSTSTNGF